MIIFTAFLKISVEPEIFSLPSFIQNSDTKQMLGHLSQVRELKPSAVECRGRKGGREGEHEILILWKLPLLAVDPC